MSKEQIKFDKRNYRKHNDKNKELINEIWHNIEGYEGLYQVSNYGRVKSLSRPYKNQYGEFGNKKEFIKAQKLCSFDSSTKEKSGYLVVNLAKDDRGKWVRVHRLVAQAFLENPLNLLEVNHKDGNKLNNNVDNLEWVTHAQNCIHAWQNGLRNENEQARRLKIKLKNQKLKNISKEMVLDIFKNCILGDKSKNAHHFAEKYGICVQTVCNIKSLKNKTYKDIIAGGMA